MRKAVYLLLFLLISGLAWSQESQIISGKVLNDANDLPLENVNIVNLNQVIGTTTNKSGEFNIKAAVNDTLYFSYPT